MKYQRMKAFALCVIRFVSAWPTSKFADVLSYQLLRSATSIGANYREANRAEKDKVAGEELKVRPAKAGSIGVVLAIEGGIPEGGDSLSQGLGNEVERDVWSTGHRGDQRG